ncbi:MAG TPA: hypothetical protein VLX68_14905 [Chitinivibrionales bacterium]|nr:hypothetical protein [Chitinivibrionales bacterium]
MVLWDMLTALFIGLLFTGIFIAGAGGVRGWPAMVAAFLEIFLIAWAAEKWVTPLYGAVHGINWFAPVMAGLFMALVLGATLTGRAPNRANENSMRTNTMFWMSVLFLSVAVISGYFAFSEKRPLAKGAMIGAYEHIHDTITVPRNAKSVRTDSARAQDAGVHDSARFSP